MEFKEISFWDGKDKETDVIAKFSLKFETIKEKKHWGIHSLFLRVISEWQIQPNPDSCYSTGKNIPASAGLKDSCFFPRQEHENAPWKRKK